MLAQEETRRLGHNFVGTEQILLGLIGEGTGIAAKVLKAKNITLKDVRVEVEKIIGRGSGFVAVEIPMTPRGKRALELSWDEARNLGHNYIGTEHLLMGLLAEGEGVAARVLENLGITDLRELKKDVIKFLGDYAATGITPLKEESSRSSLAELVKSFQAMEQTTKSLNAKLDQLDLDLKELRQTVIGMLMWPDYTHKKDK